MASKFFSDFLKHATRNVLKTEGINAQEFIANTVNQLEPISDKVLADRPRDLSVGSMYMFIYDAKWKKTLPYWDIRPLIFPISRSKDRFMGINFHYLPVPYRAMLMDALYDFAIDPNEGESKTNAEGIEALAGEELIEGGILGAIASAVIEENKKPKFKGYSSDTYLDISYGVLNGISKYRYFKPTVHIYLNKHVKSRFIWIPAKHWKKTLLLPLQQWKSYHNKGESDVYRDSLSRIK